MKTRRNKLAIFVLFILAISCINQPNGIKEVPPEVDSINRKAMFLARINPNDPQVLSLLEDAKTMAPNYYKTYTNFANLYTWQKNYEKAIEYSTNSLKLNPEIADRWFNTGLLYEKTAKNKKAQKCYKKSVEIFSKQIKEEQNEAEINSLIYRRAISKIFSNDNSYKEDFDTLKKNKSYKDLIQIVENKSRETLFSEFIK